MALLCMAVLFRSAVRSLFFADFMRPAIRMAALMGLRSIFVLTHDSIALGEDGPTHQPIEQTMSLRMIPGLSVFRPADALETAAAWQMACMNLHKPTALLLSRQKLPVLHEYAAIVHENAYKGAYVLNPGQGETKCGAYCYRQRGAFGFGGAGLFC